ncbi:MAG: SDR family oxidoreductase [Myxococcales bacterium]|nr:SDR family oxidoreductase [Myxococcales bacterium]
MTNPGPLVLVTGSTDGIGRQTARGLLERGARVIIHGRSEGRVEGTIDGLANELGASLEGRAFGATGDLASLASIRALADDLLSRFDRLDVLLHNAGVFETDAALTDDGFERTIAINHIAPFVLTHALLGPLGAARGRVVTVSSIAHQRGRIIPESFQDLAGFEGYRAYAQSKLANVLFANAMAERLAPVGVTSNSLHPGVVGTKLLEKGFGMNGNDSLEEGAATSIHLALSPGVAGVTGAYFVRSSAVAPSALARDRAAAEALYALTAQLTGTTPLPNSRG